MKECLRFSVGIFMYTNYPTYFTCNMRVGHYQNDLFKEEKRLDEYVKSKEKLLAFARLIVRKCSHDEIELLCTALLHANTISKVQKAK